MEQEIQTDSRGIGMHINKLHKPSEQYEYYSEKCPHCNGKLTMALYCYVCGGRWEKSEIDEDMCDLCRNDPVDCYCFDDDNPTKED